MTSAFVLVATLVTIPPGWVDLVGDVPSRPITPPR
jgi:hypothetical protein